ncbi:MAG TPA: hypothetical protein VK934_09815 [Fimbriimonas sp.]|nr:hypothetical protein [Fimbriimonas sp.]
MTKGNTFSSLLLFTSGNTAPRRRALAGAWLVGLAALVIGCGGQGSPGTTGLTDGSTDGTTATDGSTSTTSGPPSVGVAFNNSSGIYTMDANGANQKKIGTGIVQSLALSPDGKRIVYRDRNDVWAMNSDGSGKMMLISESEGLINGGVRFSPDSSKIIYSVLLSGMTKLRMVPASGGSAVTLREEAWIQIGDYSYSSDGSKIVYAAKPFGKLAGSIVTIDANGGGRSEVAKLGAMPTFTSDGSQIVFSKWVTLSKMYLYRVNSDGADEQQLIPGTQPADNSTRATPSANGSFLIFTSGVGTLLPYRVNLNGSGLAQLQSAGPTTQHQPTRNGAYILFEQGGRLMKMNLDGSESGLLSASVQYVSTGVLAFREV